jgi:quinol monooxygenase YgiN
MNTERITMLVTLNVGQENVVLFKQLSKELAEIVESNEPSTKGYEWFLDATEETCVIVETYPNSESLLSHLENVGEKLGPILEAAPLSQILVLGSVSDKASEALAGFGAKIMPLHAGFQR